MPNITNNPSRKLGFEKLEDRNLMNATALSGASFNQNIAAEIAPTSTDPSIDLSSLKEVTPNYINGSSPGLKPLEGITADAASARGLDPDDLIEQGVTVLDTHPVYALDISEVIEQYPDVLTKTADLYPEAVTARHDHFFEVDINGTNVLIYDYTFQDQSGTEYQTLMAADLNSGKVQTLKSYLANAECDLQNCNELRVFDANYDEPIEITISTGLDPKTGELAQTAYITVHCEATLKNQDGSYCEGYYPATLRFTAVSENEKEIPSYIQPPDQPPVPPTPVPPVTPHVDPPRIVINDTPISEPYVPKQGSAPGGVSKEREPKKVASCECECVEEPVVYISECGCEVVVYYNGNVKYNHSKQVEAVPLEPATEEKEEGPTEPAMVFSEEEFINNHEYLKKDVAAETEQNEANGKETGEKAADNTVVKKVEAETKQETDKKTAVSEATIAVSFAGAAITERRPGLLGKLFGKR